MSEITMKSTKQVIYDAYQEALEKIKKQSALTEDPLKDVKAATAAKIQADAEDIVNSGILNTEYTDKWKSLNLAITEKEKELADLYDIQKEADALAAIVNAHKLKAYELAEAYKAKESDLVTAYAEKKAELDKSHAICLEAIKEEREAATKEYHAHKAQLEAAINEQQALANQSRKREQEEYTYNLKRQRALDNDRWEDEKAQREKEIAEKEATAAKLLADAETKIEYIAELEAKVAAFPQELSEAVVEAENKGKKAAGKEYGYEKNMYMKEKEYEIKSLIDAKERAEAALEAANQKIQALTDKLDESYARMQELASTTVKSNGGVKILDRESASSK